MKGVATQAMRTKRGIEEEAMVEADMVIDKAEVVGITERVTTTTIIIIQKRMVVLILYATFLLLERSIRGSVISVPS